MLANVQVKYIKDRLTKMSKSFLDKFTLNMFHV